MHNNRNNRETVIIPQTIIVPTKSIIVASLVLRTAFSCGLKKPVLSVAEMFPSPRRRRIVNKVIFFLLRTKYSRSFVKLQLNP